MLEVGIVIEGITRDVVRVVCPFPPRDADSGDALPDEDSGKLIPPAGRHHLVMTGIVA